MAEKRTRYTSEYRLEAADYAIASGRPVRQVAIELGIEPKTMSNWVGKRRRELDDPEAAADAQADGAELKAARRRIAELEAENAFLKKRAPTSRGSRDCEPL